jgi:uncharacterized membrane protein (UPF0182 family)
MCSENRRKLKSELIIGDFYMHSIALFILVSGGIGLIVYAIRNRKFGFLASGIAIIAGVSIFFGLLDFWGEMLWFEAMDYNRRFWEAVWVKAASGLAGSLFGMFFVYLMTAGIAQENREKRKVRIGAVVLGGIVGGFHGYTNWDVILKFFHQAPTRLQDPIFGHPVGFYLFHLPFYDTMYHLLLVVSVITLSTAAITEFVSTQPGGTVSLAIASGRKNLNAIFRCSGLLLLVLALGKYLDRFHLMYSELGAVTGPGWTDVHIRIPALIIIVGVMLVAGIFLLIPPLHRSVQNRFKGRQGESSHSPIYTL